MGFERDTRRFVYKISDFIIRRFPFWEAFSSAMLLGEWEGKRRLPGIPDYVLYAHIGICILLGTLMSFDERKRRMASLMSAVQMMVVMFASLTIWKNQMVALKIFSRNLGVVAAYLLVSSGFADLRASNRRYQQLGSFSLGISLVSQAYLLYTWSAERSKFISLLPSIISQHGEFVILTYCVLFCLCGFCFMSGSSVGMGAKCGLALWVLIAVVNFDYGYWTSYLELWTQFRIIAGDIGIGSVLAVTYAMTI